MEHLVNELQNHTKDLIEELNSIEDDVYFTKPSPERWSIAEVIAHLYISDSLMNKVLTGNVEIANRDPNEKTHILKATFLNFDANYKAIEILVPKPGVTKTNEEMIAKISAIRAEFLKIIRAKDPDLLCLDFTHPNLGQMTRRELGYLMLYHSIRHYDQIKVTKAAVC